MKRSLLGLVLVFLGVGGCAGTPAVLHGGRPRAQAFSPQPPPGDFGLSRFSQVGPALLGYDAVTLSAVPHRPAVVGCYADGHYANCGTAMRDFPLAHIVSIDVRASDVGARCLDTEPGDSSPSQVAGWIRRELQLHIVHPCDYSDASESGQVLADVNRAGIPRGVWFRWLADWDGIAAIPAGYKAKQYRSTSSLDYDSFAADFFAQPAPKPKPKPACTAKCRSLRRALVQTRKAEAGVRRGLAHGHCRRPYRRDVCVDLGREILPKLQARERYFVRALSHYKGGTG